MMSSRFTPMALWAIALGLGLLCGQLAHQAVDHSAEGARVGRDHAVDGSPGDRSRPHALLSPTSQYLWREAAGLRVADSFDEAVTQLHRESRSPLRANSLQSFRIQNSSFEEWEPLLAEGKVVRIELLKELGAHLAELDSGRALDLVHYGPRQFGHLDQFYAFRNAVFHTVTASDPERVLKHLQGLTRGGTQQDSSRYFSEYWATQDPAAAAEHFDDLVWLRNMTHTTPALPEKDLADIIMKSWTQQDPAAALDHIDRLPAGSQREAFQSAFDELKSSPAP